MSPQKHIWDKNEKTKKNDFPVRVFLDWRVIIMKRTIMSLKVYKENG